MKKNETVSTETKQSKKRSKRNISTGIAPFGLILFLIDRLSDVIYRAFSNGLFGKIFTAYSKEQASFEQGFLKNHFISTKFKNIFRKFRSYLSSSIENSLFLSKISKNRHGWLSLPLKSYGVAFFFFGFYTVLVYLIRLVIPELESSDLGFLFTGLIVCIVSLPTFLSHDSLAKSLGLGVIVKLITADFLGYRKETFEVAPVVCRSKSNALLFGAMLLGMLTLFIHPLSILGILGIIFAVILILGTPEIGVISLLFFLPFLSFFPSPAMLLGILVLVASISYLVKLFRGKRILKFELLDLAVVLFALIIFFSGTISAGGTIGFYEALLSCTLILGYFLVVNLMRTEQWLKRCICALASSGTIVAIYGILQYFLRSVHVEAWVDSQYFSEIEGRAVSVFDNPNVLGSYLIFILPFVLFLWCKAEFVRDKILYLISFASILICVVLTWSRGAWLAVIVSLLAFGFLYSKKTLRTLLFAGLFIPFLSIVLPTSITKRFMSIGNLADSSTAYRFYTWKGSLRVAREHFWGGIGYGTSSYQNIYPQFAYVGIEAAEHSHNLFLQIMIGTGIGGLIVFLCILFLSAQMNFEYLKNSKNADSRHMVIAAMSAILAALVMGLFDFIWYNYRILFLFWTVLAFAAACVRTGNAEEQRHSFVPCYESNESTIEFEL